MKRDDRAAALRAGVDRHFAELRAKAIETTSADGTAPAPDWDGDVPVPWCSAHRCPFWDGERCHVLRTAPKLGVCDVVFAAMYPPPPPAPVIVNAPAGARVEDCDRPCCAAERGEDPEEP